MEQIALTANQKFLAMKALGDASIKMDVYGKWYVSIFAVEVKHGAMLSGLPVPHTETMQDAVEQSWKGLTELSGDRYIVINAMGATRRAVRWNGFMWEQLCESE